MKLREKPTENNRKTKYHEVTKRCRVSQNED